MQKLSHFAPILLHYLIDIFMIPLLISIFLKDFLSITISIFFRIALSISIFSKISVSILIFSKMTILTSLSISIFFKSVDISTIDIRYRYSEQGEMDGMGWTAERPTEAIKPPYTQRSISAFIHPGKHLSLHTSMGSCKLVLGAPPKNLIYRPINDPLQAISILGLFTL